MSDAASWYRPTQPSDLRCRLCEREVPQQLLTLHHLKPKEKGGKAEHRVPLCKPCHKQVHATFANRDLAKSYADLDALRRAPELQPFLTWIRKQKPDRNFRTATAETHPHAKRARRCRGR